MWSALGKYKSIVVSIALFLLLDASVLILNFYISFKISDDAVGVNLAGRQRMLSQRTVKTLYEMSANERGSEDFTKASQELELSYSLFNTTLQAFDLGGTTKGADGSEVILKPVSSSKGREALEEAKSLWQPYSAAILAVINAKTPGEHQQALHSATTIASHTNLPLLKLMNTLTVDLENVATGQAQFLRYIQTGGISLAVINFLIILFHFIGELRTNDKRLEIARKETTDILNTVNEGLFLLDKDLKLGKQHSARLPEMFGGKDLNGLHFNDLIRDLVKPKDMETAQRFVSLLFRPNVKESLIKDLNPLNEVELNIPDENGGYINRYLSFEFSRVAGTDNEQQILVTVVDITRSIVLAKQLAEEKERNEQQMEMLTGILHTEPRSLSRFIKNAFDTFKTINDTLKSQTKNNEAMRRKLDEIFIEVHNFKGDASALELDTFADLAHRFEDDIQRLKQNREISGNDFLALTVHLENLIRYTEGVQAIADKLAAFAEENQTSSAEAPTKKFDQHWQHLYSLTESVAKRQNKQAYLVLTGFNETAVSPQTEKFISDISIQFIRNAIVHSLEQADVRQRRHKPAQGRIDARLVRLPTGDLELSVRDDGTGINYEKIRSRALESGRWNDEEIKAMTHKQLLPLIFESGFSTTDNADDDSGRGVGMGVIRKHINALGGKLRISTRSGTDCQFTVTLPDKQHTEIAA